MKERPFNIQEVSKKIGLSIPDILWKGVNGEIRFVVFLQTVPVGDVKFVDELLFGKHENGWFQLLQEDIEPIYSNYHKSENFKIKYFLDQKRKKRCNYLFIPPYEHTLPTETILSINDLHIPVEDVDLLKETRLTANDIKNDATKHIGGWVAGQPKKLKGGRNKEPLSEAIEAAYKHFLEERNVEILKPGNIRQFLKSLQELITENEALDEWVKDNGKRKVKQYLILRIKEVKISRSGQYSIRTNEQTLDNKNIRPGRTYNKTEISKRLTSLRKKYPLTV